jgi:demethylmenaquinone methyltransferase/2-methoxy-6-polyprenyl-1,4-benzoquinol methylase
MFADIAPTYDFLNHLLSASRDKAWRRAAGRLAAPQAGERVLDACTGTGDFAFELARQAEGRAWVIGTDFCREMLGLAKSKRLRGRPPGVALAAADTLSLPFADRSFDLVTIGFGIRNVRDLDAALREIHRLLRPGGRVLILEFTTPRWAWFRRLFGLYFDHILPRVGRRLAAAPDPDLDDAYRYLPMSVRAFPDAAGLAAAMAAAGFERVEHHLLTLGIVAMHLGFRPSCR